MDYTIEKLDGATLVTLKVARLDGAVSDRLRDKLATLFQGGEDVVLDFGFLSHFDGRGLGALLHWLKTAEHSSTHVLICGLSKPVRSLFELLGLHKLVEICPSREDALAARYSEPEAARAAVANG